MRRRTIFSIFIIFYLYFLLGGLLSYRLANYFWFINYDFNYQVSFLMPILYALAALAAFLLAYFTFEKIKFKSGLTNNETTKPVGSSEDRYIPALLALFGVGAAGFLLMMSQYGGKIPLLSEHADDFRTRISSGLPQILYFQLVLTAVLGYFRAGRSRERKQRYLMAGITVISLCLILMGGSRSMFLTPVLVILIDVWRKKVIKTGYLVMAGTAAVIIWFAVGILRMGVELGPEIFLLRFAADFAPEFREFAKLLAYIPDKIGYLNGQMFTNTFYIMIPGGVLDLVGVAKSVDWVPFGEFLKNLFGYEFAGGGLRAGLIAEFYANFGPWGIIGGFYFLGIIIRFFDSRINRFSGDKSALYLLIGISLASSTLFTLDAVIYKIAAFIFGWIIYKAVLFAISEISLTIPQN